MNKPTPRRRAPAPRSSTPAADLEYLVMKASFEVPGGHRLRCRVLVLPCEGGFVARGISLTWSPVFPNMQDAIQHEAMLALGFVVGRETHH